MRPLVPADRPLYMEALGSLSPETLYTRFFASNRPADAVVQRLLDIDYIDHVAWVAVRAESPEEPSLGVGRLVAEPKDGSCAEFAVAVVDAHQRKGVGQLLMGTLGSVADTRGLATITGRVMTQNRRMRALCNKADAS